MKEYKKSYIGFVLWLVVFCGAYFACIFLPKDNTQLLLAIMDNILTLGCFILTLIIYLTQKIYWYNGISYAEAKAAGEERRKKYALKIMLYFGIAALAYLAYTAVSLFFGIPYGVDIVVACIAVIAAALSTIGVKL